MRGAGSTRFHPNRRASIDHNPGPSMARAPPMVASKRATHLSPVIVIICQTSSKATKAPAMGVHRPGMRSSPNSARNKDVSVVLIGGSLQRVELARTISAEPRTRRMRSKPIPGRPPANVEYSRRKTHLSNSKSLILRRRIEAPERVVVRHSLEFSHPSLEFRREPVGETRAR